MSRRTNTRTALAESTVMGGGTLKVDRGQGVIYGVKIIGCTSKNGRYYSRDVLQEAIPLYQGKAVNANHDRSGGGRIVEDGLGWLENVTFRDDGLYGDLYLLKSHDMFERICEAAERNPSIFGLSHDAAGDTKLVDGKLYVTKITEVNSVDLVKDPATTNGLFESREHKPMNLKEKLINAKLADASKLFRASFLEEDMVATMPEQPTPEEALKAGFKAAINAVIDDDTLDTKTKMAKLKDLMNTQDKLISPEEPAAEAPAEESEYSDDDEENSVKEQVNALQKKIAAYELEKKISTLLEQHKLQADDVLRAILMEAKSDGDRTKIIEREKRVQGKPRSAAPGRTASTTQGAVDRKSFLESVTN